MTEVQEGVALTPEQEIAKRNADNDKAFRLALAHEDTRLGQFMRAYLEGLDRTRADNPERYTTTLQNWQIATKVKTQLASQGAAGVVWDSSLAGVYAAETLGVVKSNVAHWDAWLKGDDAYAKFIAPEPVEVNTPTGEQLPDDANTQANEA